ncbi:hypothetical protein GGR52DRAFT_57022 [Hypoxylon sp. FL1284]|nr:hypothetical protein GGR52DRAFT_57022 [Hypoxylon sp. FL1284]
MSTTGLLVSIVLFAFFRSSSDFEHLLSRTHLADDHRLCFSAIPVSPSPLLKEPSLTCLMIKPIPYACNAHPEHPVVLTKAVISETYPI